MPGPHCRLFLPLCFKGISSWGEGVAGARQKGCIPVIRAFSVFGSDLNWCCLKGLHLKAWCYCAAWHTASFEVISCAIVRIIWSAALGLGALSRTCRPLGSRYCSMGQNFSVNFQVAFDPFFNHRTWSLTVPGIFMALSYSIRSFWRTVVLLGGVLLFICQPQIMRNPLNGLKGHWAFHWHKIWTVLWYWAWPDVFQMTDFFEVVIIFLVVRLDLLLKEFICDVGL